MSAEVACNWADDGCPDLWTIHADEAVAKHRFNSAIQSLLEKTSADEAVLCLTDGANWRLAVYPLYKSNRKDKRKPMLLPVLRQHALDTFRTYLRPGLEGDDCLGILGTHPTIIPGEKLIATKDKDLKTIPGLHYNWGKAHLGVFEVSTEEADRFHLIQALAGDATDGYPGCPMMGMDRAAQALDAKAAWERYAHEFKSGVRKGQIEDRWRAVEASSAWHTVVSHYEKAGQSETEALAMARVARILRASDFDFNKKEPILWTP